MESRNSILESKRNKKDTKSLLVSILIIGIVALIMILPQLFQHGLILGNDALFHFSRFYESYMQIKTGHFNFFQSLFGFYRSGRIINAIYGPDFAYLQGLIMFFTKNWFRYQLTTSFFCFFISGVSMFCLARRLKIEYVFSIFVSTLYMSSSMISFYALSQNFTSWGAAFLPFIYLPAIRAMQDPKEPIKVLELTLAVSCLIFVHNLTFLIGLISIIPFYFIGFFRAKNKLKMISDLLLSVILTVALNLNTLIGYIDVFFSNNLVSPWLYDDMLDGTIRITSGDNSWGSLGIIFSLIMLFTIFYTFINKKELSMLEKTVNTVGSFSLLFSSYLIPWNDVVTFLPVLKIIQFPRRIAVVGYILLLVGFTLILQRIFHNVSINKKKVYLPILCVVSFLSISNASVTINDHAAYWKTDAPLATGNNEDFALTDDIDTIKKGFTSGNYEDAFKVIGKSTPDYLPMPDNMTQEEIVKQSAYQMYKKQIITNSLNVERTFDEQNRIVLKWNNSDGKKAIVPVIVYANSIVTLNGKEYDSDKIEKTNIGCPIINDKVGENEMVIGYKAKANMKIVFLIKIMAMAFVLVYLLYCLIKRCI